MSNSDKEFEEWFSEQNPWFIDPKGVVEKAWNHHYPYKERCETLEAKVKDYELGHRGACFTCEPVGELNQKLEALLLKACGLITKYNYTDVLGLTTEMRLFLEKPFIKNLLNKEGNTGGTMTKPVNKRAIELFNRIYKTAPEIDYRRIEGLIDEMEVLNSKVKEHEGNYPKFTALENVEMSEKIEALESKVKELEEFIGEVVVCSQLDRESSKFYEFLELEIFDKSKKLLEGVNGE